FPRRRRITASATDPAVWVRASPMARILFALYVVLTAYASLYPLEGWHNHGLSPLAFLDAPWPRYITAFDLAVNLLGYMPYGFLCVAALEPRLRGVGAVGAHPVARARGGAELPAGARRGEPRRALQPGWRRARRGAGCGARAALDARRTDRPRARGAVPPGRRHRYRPGAGRAVAVHAAQPRDAALCRRRPA